MKFLTLCNDDRIELAVKTDRGVLKVSEIASTDSISSDVPQSIEEVIDGGQETLNLLRKSVDLALESGNSKMFLSEDSLDIGPCVSRPEKIICVGLNYRKHAEETNSPIPQYPILFNKYRNAIAAHDDKVPIPSSSTQVDYEAELCIVIGKSAKNVSQEKALDYVFGYCNANDISARDLQHRTGQWMLGKTCDNFCPLGPYLVTADEVGDPNALRIRTYVNGEVRQNSNTADMIFHVNEIVSYASKHMTLKPGDIILTGTPEGVIAGFPETQQEWLKEGDEVTVEIDKLGRLVNHFVKDN